MRGGILFSVKHIPQIASGPSFRFSLLKWPNWRYFKALVMILRLHYHWHTIYNHVSDHPLFI